MNDWYIDRSKNFKNESLIPALELFSNICTSSISSQQLIDEMTKKEVVGIAEGNPNAALTRFRDHGLLTNDNIIGDSALDYVEGRLRLADLTADLFIKRPAKKSNSPNVKPFLIICKFFNNMIEMNLDHDDIFLTFSECVEYLYNCNSYDDVTYELVEKVLSEREYDLGHKFPKTRVVFKANEETNLSIWFNALKEIPVFMPQDENRNVLIPNIKQSEFFRFMSANADEFSATPTESNKSLYTYYCDRTKGLLEVVPKVIIPSTKSISMEEVQILYEYLFGYKKVSNFNYLKYFRYACFGIFFPFITMPKLVVRQISLTNKVIGEEFVKFIDSSKGYLEAFDNDEFEFQGGLKVNSAELLESNKSLFINWLKQAKKSNGENYTELTIRNYINGVVKISKLMEIDIFSLTNLEELERVYAKYSQDAKLMEVNKKYNYAHSNGFIQYLSFVKETFNVTKIPVSTIKRKPRENKKHPLNVILFGAPGTGKTYSSIEYAISILKNIDVDLSKKTVAQRYAIMDEYNELVEEGRICFTTFHQSYGYEDFIQGLRPKTSAKELLFDNVDGIFKNLCNKALNDPHNDYVLIIDEINRGNISKIFGELITLIEDDKRVGEINGLSILLPSGDSFCVPNNVYILGTMNSADKSIALIDTALRRRFSFVEMVPNETLIDNTTLKKVLTDLNLYLKKELRSTDLLVGHAFFINKNENDIESIFNKNIIPLLYEYFYEDEAKVIKALDCLKDTDFIIDKTYNGRKRVVKKSSSDAV